MWSATSDASAANSRSVPTVSGLLRWVFSASIASRNKLRVFGPCGQSLAAGIPLVTFAIIAACGVGLLSQLASGGRVTGMLAFTPGLAAAEPWRFVTSAFLHSTVFTPHIAFNMLVLYQVGPYLELSFGRVRYFTLYLLSAVGGSVGYLVLADPADPLSWGASVIGASGAVFGLFGALLVVQRRLGLSNGGLFVLVGVNFAVGLLFSGVAWQSHLGGLVTGTAASLALVLPRGPGRAIRQGLGLLVVVAVLIGWTLIVLSGYDLPAPPQAK
jgi:membrane associated rhomboid family serine protease